MQHIESLKYPAGKLTIPAEISEAKIKEYIATITEFPERVQSEIKDLTDEELSSYHYRPGGWNIIGNTPKKIFDDKNINQPALVNPGDKVNFYQITKEDYLNWNE